MKSNSKRKETKLKKLGNIAQLKHQDELMDKFEDARKALERNDVEKAKVIIDEGKNLVKKRAKLIKIADRDGWDTVREYMSDDLASNSEDEKAIAKAKKRAAMNKEKREKEKPKSRFTIRKRNDKWNKRPHCSSAYAGSSSKSSAIGQICWACGKSGHFAKTCFRNKLLTPNFGSK